MILFYSARTSGKFRAISREFRRIRPISRELKVNSREIYH
jgi:hypothetical protein